MDNSLFGSLSAELRNKIYEDVLTADKGITLDCSDSAMAFSIKAPAILPNIALTQTCREIRQETRKMYYFLNPLTIITSISTGRSDKEKFPRWEVRSNVNAFQRLIGKEHFAEIRKVQIKVQARKHTEKGFKGSYHRDQQLIYDIRSMFSQAAKVELRLEMGVEAPELSLQKGDVRLPIKFNVSWDVDADLRDTRFDARIAAAEQVASDVYILPVHPDPAWQSLNARRVDSHIQVMSLNAISLIVFGYSQIDFEWV